MKEGIIQFMKLVFINLYKYYKIRDLNDLLWMIEVINEWQCQDLSVYDFKFYVSFMIFVLINFLKKIFDFGSWNYMLNKY